MTDVSGIDQPAAPFGMFAPKGRAKIIVALARHTPIGHGSLRKQLMRIVLAEPQAAYDVEVRGLRMRLHPRDNTVEAKLLMRPDRYCGAELRHLEEALGADAAFIDIGANVGGLALPLATRRGRRVVAVRAEPAGL